MKLSGRELYSFSPFHLLKTEHYNFQEIKNSLKWMMFSY